MRHLPTLLMLFVGLSGWSYGLWVGWPSAEQWRTFQEIRSVEAQLPQVVLATTSLPAGHPLTKEDLFTARLPPAIVAQNALLRDDLAALVGRVLREPVHEFEPIRLERLAPR